MTPRAAVIIPTLAAGDALRECLAALARQSMQDFEVIVVDNSGRGAAVGMTPRVIECRTNLGFGGAVNLGIGQSTAPWIAVLNDDAAPEPGWLEALVEAGEKTERVGMCASRVLISGTGRIDSAGMLLCGDGSSKQRGHGESADRFDADDEALFPSGSAALYRRAMLDHIGLFDESFFLYCEDSDLGLRARWAGWQCRYVAAARVHHRYSHSAGQASALKAYYVERNRLFLVAKNYPLPMLPNVPFQTLSRYWWHWRLGQGKAAEFRRDSGTLALVWLVIKAHAALMRHLPVLLAKRRSIQRLRRISAVEFARLARQYSITPREVAAQ